MDSAALPSQKFGPYQLIRILGEGGMGVVWLARRADTDTRVAIKFLPHAGLSPARRERFAREIKTLAKIRHPYIARLYDAGTLTDGTPWFVMEYVEGQRLSEYCADHALPIDARLDLFYKICEAVQCAHGQEIIHRDLKPQNILVDKEGVPRLLDFGIAANCKGWTLHRTRPVQVSGSSRAITRRRNGCTMAPLACIPTSTHSASSSTNCSPTNCRHHRPMTHIRNALPISHALRGAGIDQAAQPGVTLTSSA